MKSTENIQKAIRKILKLMDRSKVYPDQVIKDMYYKEYNI